LAVASKPYWRIRLKLKYLLVLWSLDKLKSCEPTGVGFN